MKCCHVTRDTNCNEKERNAIKEMQSNTKHKFERFKGQGEGRMANQDRFDKKGINMELDR
jgi:hypothetical protein